jgi:hypothetical protein
MFFPQLSYASGWSCLEAAGSYSYQKIHGFLISGGWYFWLCHLPAAQKQQGEKNVWGFYTSRSYCCQMMKKCANLYY